MNGRHLMFIVVLCGVLLHLDAVGAADDVPGPKWEHAFARVAFGAGE